MIFRSVAGPLVFLAASVFIHMAPAWATMFGSVTGILGQQALDDYLNWCCYGCSISSHWCS